MMPIIKKWLYSDKDIFLREIVANGVDAVTKHKKLVDMGEATKEDDAYVIKVFTDETAKTLTVEDNGIGMTAEEVEKDFLASADGKDIVFSNLKEWETVEKNKI